MDYNDLSHISHSLYKVVDEVIGEEVLIEIRRTTTTLQDDVLNKHDKAYLTYLSGSKGEGLRFKTSDDDWMFILTGFKVIPSELYTNSHDINNDILVILLMKNEMTKPGFTLIRMPGTSIYRNMVSIIERLHRRRYISSKRWREWHTNSRSWKEEVTHGPCTSGAIGTYEYDYAYCLKCDIWPVNAKNCIKRLYECGWPSQDTILSIVNDGVLFVAIGAKQSYFENTEWRMSFSLAEKKLIHAMNHTQFLCYGLLKIVLKEAIDTIPEIKGLLCSYFLKTSLFWEIVSSPNDWNPYSFLAKFWKCFGRLLQWISCSYCPNFFIPQNNMFEGKIEGSNRDKLLQYLKMLYQEGFRCLTRCPSLMPLFSQAIDTPNWLVQYPDISKSAIAMCIIGEWWGTNIARLQYCHIHKVCFALHSLALEEIDSEHKGFLLRMWFCATLTATLLASRETPGSNQLKYKSYTQKKKALNRCKTGFVGSYLHQAVLCYSNGNFEETLQLAERSIVKISSTRPINVRQIFTETNYTEAGVADLPIETVVRTSLLDDVTIHNDKHIPELYIEMHGRVNDFTMITVCVPPLICALFLQFLCYEKLGLRRERDETLQYLSRLVNSDYLQDWVTEDLRDITWQLLGICQQMSGNDLEACHSYIRCLRPPCILEVAACLRLGIILVKYITCMARKYGCPLVPRCTNVSSLSFTCGILGFTIIFQLLYLLIIHIVLHAIINNWFFECHFISNSKFSTWTSLSWPWHGLYFEIITITFSSSSYLVRLGYITWFSYSCRCNRQILGPPVTARSGPHHKGRTTCIHCR